MRVRMLFITALGLVFTAGAYGREDTVPGSRYTSARGSALGDAMIAGADDTASALFYNPAAIGKIRYPSLEVLNFSVNANMDYMHHLNSNFYKVTSLKSFQPALAGMQPDAPSVGGTIFPNFGSRYFAFGILMGSQIMGQQVGETTVVHRSRYQFIPTFGTGLRLASGVLRLGYSLQWVNQASGVVSQSISSPDLGYSQGLAQGSAISHNLGFSLTLPYTYLPSLNIVARNVGGAHYQNFSAVNWAKNVNGRPADEPMSVDVSIGMLMKIGWGVNAEWSVEYRDATNASGTSPILRAATGLELLFRDSFFVRAGMGSAYPTLGAGLKQKRGEVGVSWYEEELSSSVHTRGDRRVMLHYMIRAF